MQVGQKKPHVPVVIPVSPVVTAVTPILAPVVATVISVVTSDHPSSNRSSNHRSPQAAVDGSDDLLLSAPNVSSTNGMLLGIMSVLAGGYIQITSVAWVDHV